MSQMAPRLRLYIYAVVLAGAVALLLALGSAARGIDRPHLLLSALLAGLSVTAYLAPVQLAGRRHLVLHTSLQTVSLIVLQPDLATLTVAFSVLVGNVYRGRRWFNTLFNTAQVALGVLVAGALYHRIAAADAQGVHGVRAMFALIVAGAALFLISTLAVDIATAMQRGRGVFAHWWPAHATAASSHVIMVVLGGAAASAVQRSPGLVFVAIVPVLAVHSLIGASRRFQRHTIDLAEEIASAIDERHPYLSGASRKIGLLAAHVGRANGLSQAECRRIRLAAHLHNVAAANLPDYIQLGTGTLDEHQQAFWQSHPERGGTLIAEAIGLDTVAEIIRYHHERMDGKGYPYGLHGSDIPVPARILAVCEAWVALTSDRGYRPALPLQNAWMVMQAGAGSQWDAGAVQALGAVVSGAAAAPASGERPSSAVPAVA